MDSRTAGAAHGSNIAHRRRCRRTADRGNRTGARASIAVCALLLGGCATSHIGSEWPCPASQGTPCTSVSAADPARLAPEAAAPAGYGHPEGSRRLPSRTDGNGGIAGARKSGKRSRPASERCLEVCRPFAWLRRLTGSVPGPEDSAVSGEDSESAVADAPENDREANALPEPASEEAADLAPAGLPPARLRTAEVIGRIWIAPYVDESGVYHEARWVRAVLEPARWRLP